MQAVSMLKNKRVQLHELLNSLPDVSEWLVSGFGRFTSSKELLDRRLGGFQCRFGKSVSKKKPFQK
jgi:hypothetical protein